MRIVFGIVIFIFILIIGVLIVGFALSSILGISIFGGIKEAGRGGGIIVSLDAGNSWEFKNKSEGKGDISRLNILDMVISNQNPDIIYLGTRTQGLYKSENGGESWRSVPGTEGTIYSIALDPQNQNNIYLAISKGQVGRVLESEDGGGSFGEVYIMAAPKTAVYTVAVNLNDPRIVYAGTSEGLLLESEDYGNSWKILNSFQNGVVQIFNGPASPNEIYVTTLKGGFYKTVNNGGTWENLKTPSGIKGASEITVLVPDSQSPNVLYIGSELGLFRTGSGGSAMEEVRTIIPSPSLPVSAVAIDPADSHIIYIGAQNQVYKSKDRGVSWTVKQLPTESKINIIKIHPQDPNKIFVGLGG